MSLSHDITVTELCGAYWKFAKTHYIKHGELTDAIYGVKVALRQLREKYGHTRAVEFGPLAPKAIRQQMIELDLSRTYINETVAKIKRVFKWSVREELLPIETYQALTTLEGLRAGRSAAREPARVVPVEDSVVESTLPKLSGIVADMVRFQRLTSCRPGEVCIVRPCDIDRSGDVWAYRPDSHKTEHHGRDRVIFIGPQAQQVLRPYLLRPAKAFCFSPAESVKLRREEASRCRRTPLSCGNRAGTNRKRQPKHQPGEHYSVDSYRQAIHRACAKAGVEQWSPNQLRHTAGTDIRQKYGLEAAQVILGHAAADVTQVYAERDMAKAAAVMLEIG